MRLQRIVVDQILRWVTIEQMPRDQAHFIAPSHLSSRWLPIGHAMKVWRNRRTTRERAAKRRHHPRIEEGVRCGEYLRLRSIE